VQAILRSVDPTKDEKTSKEEKKEDLEEQDEDSIFNQISSN